MCYAEIKYHLEAWWEGEDLDKRADMDECHHLYLALAWMHELMRAILEGTLVDDRPPCPRNKKWMEEANAHAVELLKARGDVPPAAPFTEVWAENERRKKKPVRDRPTVGDVLKRRPKRMTAKRPTKMKKVSKKSRKR
jgi:hypothetical protein